MVNLADDRRGGESPDFRERLRVSCTHSDKLLKKAFKDSGEAFQTDMTLDETLAVRRAIKSNVAAQRSAEGLLSDIAKEKKKLSAMKKDIEKQSNAIRLRKIELETQMRRHGFISSEGEIIKSKIIRRTVKDLIKEIGGAYGFTHKHLVGPVRTTSLSHCRQEIMWEAMKIHGRSSEEVGRALNRDHTTILHGVKVHEKRMKGAIE